MTKSERMQPVLQVASNREERAARELGESERLLQEKLRQLQDLQSYRQEYLAHFHQVGSSGATAQRLNEIQRFLSSLNAAIEHQQHQVELARMNCEQKRSSWQEARSKSLGMEKVVARFREDERVIADRKEQKMNDEHAQNRDLARRQAPSDE